MAAPLTAFIGEYLLQ